MSDHRCPTCRAHHDPEGHRCTIADCPERHCRVCHLAHVTADTRGTDHTCARCLGAVRDDLAEIWRLAAHALGVAITRGINSAAATLAGPTADPETWRNFRMTALYRPGQRIDAEWLDQQVDVPHPEWVLGNWELAVREHLDQQRTPGHVRPTLTETRDYLDSHLTWLAQDDTFAFDELATELHACRRHLEQVLDEGEHVERGVECPNCHGADLIKDWAEAETIAYTCRRCNRKVPATYDGARCPGCGTNNPPTPVLASYDADDRWTCRACNAWWTDHDYRNRVDIEYVAHASRLTASQIAVQYRVPETTIRKWAERGKIRRHGKDTAGRVLFAVDEVLAVRDKRAAATA